MSLVSTRNPSVLPVTLPLPRPRLSRAPRASRSALAALSAFVALTMACAKPEPPTLVPERVRVTSLTAASLGLEVTLRATNPNAQDLVARSVTAHVLVGGQFDLGTVEIPVTTTLPAGQTTKLDVPLSVKLADIAALGHLALTSPSIPYSVAGTVGLGGDLLHVEVPYRFEESVPREQVMRAAAASLPSFR